ncbi:hypothetical protein Rhopal_001263-T1 [Rhodotorula paludigena]|uniref:Proteophosphoglycan ppg4 n=1 Tax=Rhodotorula paludigena TaxID=86838 RepID=A0AAV5GI30_9BASI|nr:hypothetical protein Rhopal_001263-T1 [Rhodotorula paludigena]
MASPPASARPLKLEPTSPSQLARALEPGVQAHGPAGPEKEAVPEALRALKQEDSYLPTPSPAPSRDGPAPSSAVKTSPVSLERVSEAQEQDGAIAKEDAGDVSDADSLSSADSDLANAARMPSSYCTPLFNQPKCFGSPEAFFTSCRDRMLRAYGVTTQCHHLDRWQAIAKCQRQTTHHCRFAVRARKGNDGRWHVRDTGNWTHSHASELPKKDRDEVMGDESGDESEEEPLARATQTPPVASTSTSIANPTFAISEDSWSAPTKSQRMLQLVESRTSIFAKQRAVQDPVRSIQSKQASDAYTGTDGSGTNLCAFRHYVRFCDKVGVPTFPVSPAMLALWMYDKCSAKDVYSATYASALNRIMNLTKSFWSSSSLYDELVALDPDATALTEFMAERSNQKRGWSFKAYCAFVKAIMPVFGIGLIKFDKSANTATIACNRSHQQWINSPGGLCPYFIQLERTSKDPATWAIDATLSHFLHSHGPDGRILADPTWRPLVRNADARRVLGMAPLATSGKTKISQAHDEPGKKKHKENAAPPPTKKQRVIPTVPSASSPKVQQPLIHGAPTLSQPSAGASAQLLARQASAPVHPSSPAPSAPTPAAIPLQPDAVHAFLGAMHPSLVSLAPHLAHAGFDSLSSLVALLHFEPVFLDLVLEEIRFAAESPRTRAPDANGPVSVIHIKLLARLLREERAAF